MSDAPDCAEFKIAIKSIVSRIHLGHIIMNFMFEKW